MVTRRVRISTEHGAHARPVAELARLAMEHSRPVRLMTLDGSSADLSSVLAVMNLGLRQGDEIVLETAPSPNAEHVLDAMARILDPRLNPSG